MFAGLALVAAAISYPGAVSRPEFYDHADAVLGYYPCFPAMLRLRVLVALSALVQGDNMLPPTRFAPPLRQICHTAGKAAFLRHYGPDLGCVRPRIPLPLPHTHQFHPTSLAPGLTELRMH